KGCDSDGSMPGRKPEREVEQNAREKAGLRHTQQKAHGIKAIWAHDKSRPGGYQTPCDDNARNPDPGPNPIEDHIGRHLEEDVANEKDATAEAEFRRRKPNCLVHAEGGKADIDAVKKTDEVEQHGERENSPAQLAHHVSLKIQGHRNPWREASYSQFRAGASGSESAAQSRYHTGLEIGKVGNLKSCTRATGSDDGQNH